MPGGSPWEWGLSLIGYGSASALQPAAAVVPTANGNHVEYARGVLTEWYINDQHGLEQGFTLTAPLSEGTEVTLRVGIRGTLMPVRDRDGIGFMSADGVHVIDYGRLEARDAVGKRLPAQTILAAGAIDLVVDTRDATYPITIDPLASASAWSVDGTQANASFSYALGTAGDVNGDGYSDVIVSSPYYDNGQIDEGRVFVYYGSSNMSLSAAWTVESNKAGALFGLSIATAGDINGDGYSDVVIGAPFYENGQVYEGQVAVYFGSSTGLPATPNWVTESNQANAEFGNAVSSAGDINGDGFSDIIIGSPYYDNGQTNEGRAFIYHGSSAGLPATANSTVESNFVGAGFGQSVAGAGDVNGDGFGDVVVGAHLYANGEANEGRVFVFHGGPSGLLTTASRTLESNQVNAQFGYAVSTAGDINGDGYSDIVIGAPFYDNGQVDEGRAFVFHGSGTGVGAAPVWTTESNQVGATLSTSVGTTGDVNGDGYADITVGAENYSNGESSEGRAYVYTGGITGLSATAAWSGESNQANAHYGHSVGAAGDFNGDGFSDLLVGAFSYDSSQANAGRIYVYRGSSSGLAATAGWTATSSQPGDNFGISVAGAGDVNGDGYADVIIGAPFYDNAGNAEGGRALVYLGAATGLASTPSRVITSTVVTTDYLGYSVSGAGDVNGDGYADVIVWTPQYDYGLGQALLFYGSVGGLSATPAWSIIPPSPVGRTVLTTNAVHAAGDVNGDGFDDFIVEGSVFVGSPAGPSSTASWANAHPLDYRRTGLVYPAGDVNGDGYADVLAGSIPLSSGGGGRLYLGSTSGLSTSPVATNEAWEKGVGDVNGDGFDDVIGPRTATPGIFLGGTSGLNATPNWVFNYDDNLNYVIGASAGDVNGDGYQDVVLAQNPLVLAYLGGPNGPGQSPDTIFASPSGDTAIAAAGDVNGDGYGDVVWGNGQAAYLHYGNGGAGRSGAMRQRNGAGTSPVAPLGYTGHASQFQLAGLGMTEFGRGKVKLEWEVKPLDMGLDGTGLQRSAVWTDSGTAGIQLTAFIAGLQNQTAYHWRARWRYHPASLPLGLHSRWFTLATNSLQEADLRTGVPLDQDSDGLLDAIENAFGTGRLDADSDDDGIKDGIEDANHNGIVDSGETDPRSTDSDRDGLQDGTENGLTSGVADPDGAGPLKGSDLAIFVPDAQPSTTTLPADPDTDNDGALDGEEDFNHNGRVDAGEFNPNNGASIPPQPTGYRFQRTTPLLPQPWQGIHRDIHIDEDGYLYTWGGTFANNERAITKLSSRGGQVVGSFAKGLVTTETLAFAVSRTLGVYAVLPPGGIVRYDINGQLLNDQWRVSVAGDSSNAIKDIAIGSDGLVYTLRTNGLIERYTADGKLLGTVIDFSQLAGGRSPFAAGFYRDGFVYSVTDLESQCFGSGPPYPHNVEKRTLDNVLVATFAVQFDIVEDDLTCNLAYAVVVDDAGQMYVTASEAFGVSWMKLAPDGRRLDRWSQVGSAPGQFAGAKGISRDGDGNIYVVEEIGDRIQKFDAKLRYLGSGGDRSLFHRAWDVAAYGSGVNGRVYTSDNDTNRIHVFDTNLQHLATWTATAKRYLATDAAGNLYTYDLDILRKYNPSGAQLWSVAVSGGESGIAVYGSTVYVPNDYELRKYATSNGAPQGVIDLEASGVFALHTIRDVTTDLGGNLYVPGGWNYNGSEYAVAKFSSTGALLGVMGQLGAGPQKYADPWDVSVGTNGDVYITDYSGEKLSVLRPYTTLSNAKAVMISGGGAYAGNFLWDATRSITGVAYRALRYQGFGPDSIWVVSDDAPQDFDADGANDLDSAATGNSGFKATGKASILNWMSAGGGTGDIVIYLTDHGGSDTFKLGPSEVLTRAELEAWLVQVEAATTGRVTVIYDACRSGSFAPLAGPNRVVVTSSGADEVAYFAGQGSLSFSQLFWSKVQVGGSVGEAFTEATEGLTNLPTPQTPLLFADGDGQANESTDFNAVTNTYLGTQVDYAFDVPVIAQVTGPGSINGTSTASITAHQVTGITGIARVFSTVQPPAFDSAATDEENAVTDLPSFELLETAPGTYSGQFTGFNSPGTYLLAVYAVDMQGRTSAPRALSVTVGDPLRRRAVLVAGGNSGEPGWSAVESRLQQAYRALRGQGYTDETIQCLSASLVCGGSNTVASTYVNLDAALTQWAVAHTQDVVVYLVGKTDGYRFHLNGGTEIDGATLNGWLHSLQSSISGKLMLLLDSDEAGVFLGRLSAVSGNEADFYRLGSTVSGPVLTGLQGEASYSQHFWNGVGNGARLAAAHLVARQAILGASGRRQHPWLDTNGDNVSDKFDLGPVLTYRLGQGMLLAGDTPSLTGIVVDQSQAQLTPLVVPLTVGKIVATSALEEVWAEVTGPDLDGLGGNSPAATKVPLAVNGNGSYNGTFTNQAPLAGMYVVSFYAKDVDGVVGSGESLNVVRADGYELDNARNANLPPLQALVPDAPTGPQVRTLHVQTDEDWGWFNAESGKAYSVTAKPQGDRSDLQLWLYRPGCASDACATIEDAVIAGDSPLGEERLVFTATGPGTHWVRVKLDQSATEKQPVGYTLALSQDGGPTFNNAIEGQVRDLADGSPIIQAEVKITGTQNQVTVKPRTQSLLGQYAWAPVPTQVKVTVDRQYYQPYTANNVAVPPTGTFVHNIGLVPLDTDSDGLKDRLEVEVLGTDPVLADSDGDNLSDFSEVARDGNSLAYAAGVDTDPNNPDTDGDGMNDGADPDPLHAGASTKIATMPSSMLVLLAAMLTLTSIAQRRRLLMSWRGPYQE